MMMWHADVAKPWRDKWRQRVPVACKRVPSTHEHVLGAWVREKEAAGASPARVESDEADLGGR